MLLATLWDKIQFWKPKKRTPEYRFQDAPMGDGTWVEITSGKYASIVYSYGRVKFSDEIGVPKLSFGYSILHSGHFDLEALQSDQDFVTIIGDILTEIIIKNESIRNNDTQEPNSY